MPEQMTDGDESPSGIADFGIAFNSYSEKNIFIYQIVKPGFSNKLAIRQETINPRNSQYLDESITQINSFLGV
jgi:hypothetical protein